MRNTLLGWLERARAAQQRGRRHPSPGTLERPACPARREFRVRERTRPVHARVWGADGGVGVAVVRAWESGDWVIGRREGARQDMASVSRARSRREDGRGG